MKLRSMDVCISQFSNPTSAHHCFHPKGKKEKKKQQHRYYR